MRLFLAVELPAALRAGLAALQRELRPEAPGVRWVDPDLLHLTLLFLGETPEDTAAALDARVGAHLAPVAGGGAEVRGVGCFGPPAAPRVVWIGVRGAPCLAAIHGALRAAATACGLATENRPFHPHLTLGRQRDPRPDRRLAQALARRADLRAGELPVREIALLESTLAPAGPSYRVRQRWPLGCG